MEGTELEAAEEIGRLVERAVAAIERPANLGSGVVSLVPDAADEELDALLRRHLPEVKPEREDDPGAPVHPPEHEADAVLRRLGKAALVEDHLPVDRPPLGPERRAEHAALRLVARLHELLQVVPRDQLVVDGG